MVNRSGKNSTPELMFKRIFVSVLLFVVFPFAFSSAQTSYGYGTVIGGDLDQAPGGSRVQSFLQENEEGMQVTLIVSSGRGFQGGIGGGLLGVGGGGVGGQGGAARIFYVPRDTDYLELLVFYAGQDPRFLRKNKIKILRVKEAGPSPYQSSTIKRYWTKYNFNKQYKKGGPFDLLQPGDIVVVQTKGLFNRPFFDPLNDVTFLIGLPALAISTVQIIRLFR